MISRIVVLTALVVACIQQPTAASPRSPAAAPPNPPVLSAVTLADGPRYETAEDGTVYSPLDEPSFIRGHDNGQSALYDNGNGVRFSFWSFGDTGLSGQNGDGDNFLANTGARTTDLTMPDSVSEWSYEGGTGGPREFIQLNADERAFNELHADADPETAGCQPADGIAWLDCDNELAIWGGSVVADPARGRILGFYALIIRYGYRLAERPDPNNPDETIPCTDQDIADRVEACKARGFDGVGTGVAVWTESPADGNGWERKLIAHATDPAVPTAIWPTDGDPATPDPRFDTGMLVHEGFLYAYGCYAGDVFRPDCQLARVPMTEVWDRAAWRFYAGSGCSDLWSADIACAAAVPAVASDGSPSTMTGGSAGSSVFWNAALGVFMTIYSVPLSDDLHYAVADRPEGPWSAPALLGRGLPAVGDGLGSIDYAGFAHPEYAEQNGLVQYVTYAHTTGFLQSDFPLLQVTFGPLPGR